MASTNQALEKIKNRETLLEKDIWDVEDLGLIPDYLYSTYRFTFAKIEPYWLKQATKKFLRFQSTQKSLATCRSYLTKLVHFGKFLTLHHEGITPEKINRKIIVEFIEYMAYSKLGASTRGLTLIHLRTFHQMVAQEKWLPWPQDALIYSSDFPKQSQNIPRYIPETVLIQLQQNLHHLPVHMQRLINLLLETGRRVSEICTLPFDCLELDGDKDVFLRVNDKKTKKTYLIPVSDACVKLIRAQQNFLMEKENENPMIYLFPSKSSSRNPHLTARYAQLVLTKLSEKHPIKDDNGKQWHFHPHQFRHTVGTRMINAGMPQVIVQRYIMAPKN